MKPLSSIVANPSGFDSLSNYAGSMPDAEWLSVVTRTRDSDCLTESNFRSALRILGGESEDVQIFRFGHWACGWWESLSVREGTTAADTAKEITEGLEGYPVVDESDFSELEEEEAGRVWKDCYNVNERIEYIRRHRSQFEFRDLADMLGCARGNYFAGYASELLN